MYFYMNIAIEIGFSYGSLPLFHPIGELKPFSYIGLAMRRKPVNEEPHVGFCRLLHVPSIERYFK